MPGTDRGGTAQTDQYAGEAQKQTTIVAVTVLLLSGLSPAAFTQGLIALLAPLGVPAEVTVRLIAIVGWSNLTFSLEAEPERVTKAGGKLAAVAERLRLRGKGAAGRIMRRGKVARRAMYLVTAAVRMAKGGSSNAESRLLGAHLAAERKRAKAAEAIDEQVKTHGPLLGWKAVLDNRTTPLCRAAHGRNFRADTPPQIGYPGTAHGGNCRCKPRAPWPDGEMLP